MCTCSFQVAGIQVPGGTGALKLAALFLHHQIGCNTVYVSKPTWGKAPLLVLQGSHRLEKYLNIQDCLEKSLKINFALKST